MTAQSGHLSSASLGVVELLAMLRAARRPMLIGALGLAILVVVFALLKGREYTSVAVFVPERQASALGSLAGLATQFGLPLPTDDAASSPDFFADLARTSTDILLPLMSDTFSTAEGEQLSLTTYFEVRGNSPAAREARALRQFRRNLTVRVQTRSGTVSLAVKLKDPVLSAAVANRLLERVGAFNVRSRRLRARVEREFLEGRAQEVKSEMEAAEDRRLRFVEANRDYGQSVAQQLEVDRLTREVTRRNAVYTSLVESLERARLTEVRDTPVITIVETPRPAPLPDSRGLAMKLLLALAGGASLGFGFATLRPFLSAPVE